MSLNGGRSVESLGNKYLDAGLILVPIQAGTKGPRKHGWNARANALTKPEQLGGAEGLGIAHAWSGTAALDIDDLELATSWLALRGISLQTLLTAPDAVAISSGRPNRAKLLYRVPEILPTKQPTGSGLELRCGTRNGLTVQDAIPPTIHPDTQAPYEWIGDWRVIPSLPPEIESLWRTILAESSKGSVAQKALPSSIPKGERNSTLFSIATGYRRKGMEKADGLERIHRLNSERCNPPLLPDEVVRLVDSSWESPPLGFTALPNEMTDSFGFWSLSSDAIKMLLFAYRRSLSGRLEFSLTNEECRLRLFPIGRVRKARNELLQSQWLEQTQEPISGQTGKPRREGRYRLKVIWSQNEPKANTPLGIKSHTPIKIAVGGGVGCRVGEAA